MDREDAARVSSTVAGAVRAAFFHPNPAFNPVWPPRSPHQSIAAGRLYRCRCGFSVNESDPAAVRRWVRHSLVCERYWTDWRV